MRDIAADRAEFVALFVETLLYGISTVLFYKSTEILVRRRKGERIKWPLLLTSVAIYVTTTGHLVMVFCRALEAFINHRTTPGGPLKYYGNLRNALEVSQASFLVAASLLGDSMAVYRVFVVYNRNYIAIILPLLSLCGTVVTSIASVIIIGQSSTHASAFYFPKLEAWMPIFFGLTFSTSITCTCLIATRLWYVGHHGSSHITAYGTTKRASRLLLLQRILIESAMMYSTIMFIYLVLYLEKSNYNIIFGDMVSPIIGITFTLITIRVNIISTGSPTYVTQTTMPSSYAPDSQTDFKAMKMKPVPVAVKLHREINRHGTASTTNVTTDSSDAL